MQGRTLFGSPRAAGCQAGRCSADCARRDAVPSVVFAGGSRRPLHPGGGQGRIWYWVCLGSWRWWWFGSCGAMLRSASAFFGESGSCLAPRVATRGNTPPDPLTAGLRPACVIAPLRCRGLIEGQSACVCLHADARRSPPSAQPAWEHTARTPPRRAAPRRNPGR